MGGSPSKGDSNAGTIGLGNYNLDQLINGMPQQAETDKNLILSENASNLAERKGTLSEQDLARKGQLSDLATLLANRNQEALGQAAPGILEDLQSRGLARSSAVGNNYANYLSNLTANTNSQLSEQALRNAGLTTDAMGGITEADIAGKGTATARALSLNDYVNQLKAGRAMAQIGLPANQPSAPGGKSGGLAGAYGAGMGGLGYMEGMMTGSQKRAKDWQNGMQNFSQNGMLAEENMLGQQRLG